MRAATLANLAGYAAALVLAAAAVLVFAPGGARHDQAAAPAAAVAEVRDARGTPVRVRRWARIATLDLVSDELVANLVERERLVAISAWAQGPDAWRLAGLPRLSGLGDLEAILRLHPDLVLVSTFDGELDKLQRLRERGVAVFDLGPAGGMEQLLANIRRVAVLTGERERGERLATGLERRMAAVPAALPADLPRRRTLVLTPVVDQVYGGTTGTSFHDILVAAGLVDAAAGRFAEPWPRVGAEAALAIDPDVVVTRSGGAAELRRIPGFSRLRALQSPEGVIELPGELYDSPGLGMLDAAEELLRRAYPGKAP